MLKVASSALNMGPHHTMQIAERLYTQGFISYPRTESSRYPPNYDFRSILTSHKKHPIWGSYVQSLNQEGFTPSKVRINVRVVEMVIRVELMRVIIRRSVLLPVQQARISREMLGGCMSTLQGISLRPYHKMHSLKITKLKLLALESISQPMEVAYLKKDSSLLCLGK